MGVSDLHIARHSLDQSHEALQLRRDVIWGQRGGGGGINVNTRHLKANHVKVDPQGLASLPRYPEQLSM